MPPKKTTTADGGADGNQRAKDADFILEALLHVTTPVMINVAEVAEAQNAKVNTIFKRFSTMRNRYPGLNIQATTVTPSTNVGSSTTIAASTPTTPKMAKSSPSGSKKNAKVYKSKSRVATSDDESDNKTAKKDGVKDEEGTVNDGSPTGTTAKKVVRKTPANTGKPVAKTTGNKRKAKDDGKSQPTKKAAVGKGKAAMKDKEKAMPNTQDKSSSSEREESEVDSSESAEDESDSDGATQHEKSQSQLEKAATAKELALDIVQQLAEKSRKTPLRQSISPIKPPASTPKQTHDNHSKDNVKSGEEVIAKEEIINNQATVEDIDEGDGKDEYKHKIPVEDPADKDMQD